MAKLNKFDRAIKKQVKDLEAEPSARVWVGIREEIGTGRSEGMVWLYRSAAAILLLALVGASIWWYLDREPAANSGQMAGAVQEQTVPEVAPAPEEVLSPAPQQQFLADEGKEEVDSKASPSSKAEKVEPGQRLPLAEESSPQPTPPPVEKALEEEVQVPMEETPEVIVEEPVEFEAEELERIEEEERAPELQENDQKEVIALEEQPESAATRRKQINLNQLRKNLSREQLKETSGNVLGSVAEGAKKAIGLDTEFEKTTTKEYENKEFTARLGPIKFKRSRKVKK